MFFLSYLHLLSVGRLYRFAVWRDGASFTPSTDAVLLLTNAAEWW